MKSLTVLMFLLAAACGDDTRYTWGDATTAIATAFCDRMASCGYADAPGREHCVEHTEFHFCLEDTCDVVLPDEAIDEAETCVTSIADANCFLIGFYGVVPPECGPIFDREPSP